MWHFSKPTGDSGWHCKGKALSWNLNCLWSLPTGKLETGHWVPVRFWSAPNQNPGGGRKSRDWDMLELQATASLSDVFPKVGQNRPSTSTIIRVTPSWMPWLPYCRTREESGPYTKPKRFTSLRESEGMHVHIWPQLVSWRPWQPGWRKHQGAFY